MEIETDRRSTSIHGDPSTGWAEIRDERRDGFAQVVKKAMETRLGSSSDEVRKVLAKRSEVDQKASALLSLAK